MDMVNRERLTGFRQPTAWEKTGIERYLKQKNKRYLNAISFWNCFFSVLAGSILFNQLADGRNLSGRETAVNFFFFAAAVWGVSRIRRYRKEKRKFLDKLSRGEFQVMDCRSYEECFNSDLTDEAVVKIYNEAGQYCDYRFVLDLETVKQCKKNKEIGLLLMKCSDYYELLSERRMRGGAK